MPCVQTALQPLCIYFTFSTKLSTPSQFASQCALQPACPSEVIRTMLVFFFFFPWESTAVQPSRARHLCSLRSPRSKQEDWISPDKALFIFSQADILNRSSNITTLTTAMRWDVIGCVTARECNMRNNQHSTLSITASAVWERQPYRKHDTLISIGAAAQPTHPPSDDVQPSAADTQQLTYRCYQSQARAGTRDQLTSITLICFHK